MKVLQQSQNPQENHLIPISDKISLSNNNELTKMNKVTPPTWEMLSVNKAQEALQNIPDEAKESLQRVAHSVYKRMLHSTRGRTLIAKADEYNIPYDRNDIDFLELIDLIDEYEHLLHEAMACNIEWDLSIYDVIGLSQKIEDYKFQDIRAQRELRRDFLDSVI